MLQEDRWRIVMMNGRTIWRIWDSQGVRKVGSFLQKRCSNFADDMLTWQLELLAMGEDGGRQSKARDDETNVRAHLHTWKHIDTLANPSLQGFLLQFFKEIYHDNIGNFREIVQALTEDERYQLAQLGGQS